MPIVNLGLYVFKGALVSLVVGGLQSFGHLVWAGQVMKVLLKRNQFNKSFIAYLALHLPHLYSRDSRIAALEEGI